ncbi:MAG: hydrogenase maturation nickel metallochaperone HypA [Deltaproteobacteria bacterium]|nr:hydrogenase maturation nickel metallochaperone HypA [Deltaproteobacteria bacterium]
MHEMSIAHSLIEIIRDEMGKNNAKILRSVHLKIGEMSSIVPEALSFCFEVMTADTELEGAMLVMDKVPLKGFCPLCDKEFGVAEYDFTCPSCGCTDTRMIAGQDLSLVEIEVD